MKHFLLPLVALLTTTSIDIVTAVPVTSGESGDQSTPQEVAVIPPQTGQTLGQIPSSETGSGKENQDLMVPFALWTGSLGFLASTKVANEWWQSRSEKLEVEDDQRELAKMTPGTLYQECYEAKLFQWLQESGQLQPGQTLTWWYQFRGPALYGEQHDLHTKKHWEHTEICSKRDLATPIVLEQRRKTREAARARQAERALSRLPPSDRRVVNQRRYKGGMTYHSEKTAPEELVNNLKSDAFWSQLGDSSREALQKGSAAAASRLKAVPASVAKVRPVVVP